MEAWGERDSGVIMKKPFWGFSEKCVLNERMQNLATPPIKRKCSHEEDGSKRCI